KGIRYGGGGVRRARLESVLAAVPYRASIPGTPRLWAQRFPFQIEGIRRPEKRGLQKRGCSECTLARSPHIHLFRLSHLHGIRRGADRRRDPESFEGIRKVALKASFWPKRILRCWTGCRMALQSENAKNNERPANYQVRARRD